MTERSATGWYPELEIRDPGMPWFSSKLFFEDIIVSSWSTSMTPAV
jgi:hypothetical protein